MRRTVDKAGSLLIEALMAMVILSVSLTLIIQSLVSSLKAATYSTDYAKAMFLVDNKVFELTKDKFTVSDYPRDGYFPKPFEDHSFQIESLGYPDDKLNEFIDTVHLQVGLKTSKGNKMIAVDTFVLKPVEEN